MKAGWFVSHVGGCLSTYAALHGIEGLDAALERMAADVWASRVGREFGEEVWKKALKLVRALGEGRNDAETWEQ